jgi:hypothetical protein
VGFLGPLQQEEKHGKAAPRCCADKSWGVFLQGAWCPMICRKYHIFKLLQVSCGHRTFLVLDQEL